MPLNVYVRSAIGLINQKMNKHNKLQGLIWLRKKVEFARHQHDKQR